MKRVLGSTNSGITSIATSNNRYENDEQDCDEEQQLRQMVEFGLQTLCDLRLLCLRSNENFRIAIKLHNKASKSHKKADDQKRRQELRNGVTRMKENYSRNKGIRCERSCNYHVLLAFEQLEAVYCVINNARFERNYIPQTIEEASQHIEYIEIMSFLRGRYQQSMKHLGAGRIPSFRTTKLLNPADSCLGQTLSGRQAELLTKMITQVEEDLKDIPIKPIKKWPTIPWVVVFRPCQRDNSIKY